MAMTTVTARPVIRQARRTPEPDYIRLMPRILRVGFPYEFPFRFAGVD